MRNFAQVRTLEDLRSLTVGAAIIDFDHDVSQKRADGWHVADIHEDTVFSDEEMVTFLPATVLYPVEFNGMTFNRFEYVDYRDSAGKNRAGRNAICGFGIGGTAQISIQDDGRTLKVFVDDKGES